jgi:hypothetical protein
MDTETSLYYLRENARLAERRIARAEAEIARDQGTLAHLRARIAELTTGASPAQP